MHVHKYYSRVLYAVQAFLMYKLFFSALSACFTLFKCLMMLEATVTVHSRRNNLTSPSQYIHTYIHILAYLFRVRETIDKYTSIRSIFPSNMTVLVYRLSEQATCITGLKILDPYWWWLLMETASGFVSQSTSIYIKSKYIDSRG
jgi:hypothetical protein